MWNIFSQPSFQTTTFVFMVYQRSSNKKHINMWYQIASSASNQRAKFVGFTLQTYDLQDGVANSEKAFLNLSRSLLKNEYISWCSWSKSSSCNAFKRSLSIVYINFLLKSVTNTIDNHINSLIKQLVFLNFKYKFYRRSFSFLIMTRNFSFSR